MKSYFRQRTCLKLLYMRKITRIRIRISIPGSGSAYNQCGSETLLVSLVKYQTNLEKQIIDFYKH
jgi:hypothetical protein